MTSFLKMHGSGNDFAVFDGRVFPVPMTAVIARAIADRKRGIGCDQVIVMEKAANSAAAFMRIFNADGSEVESCGNAARCIAWLLMAEHETDHINIATAGGMLACRNVGNDEVSVDMGPPRLDWREIPMAQAVDTANFAIPVPDFRQDFLQKAAAVSMGNPHCVLFVDDSEAAPVQILGPLIEHHPWFPYRANVEFVTVAGEDHLRMRVWERGAGVTLACGTGACAAVVAAHLRGLTARKSKVTLDGGDLQIEWREADGHVLMTGPARFSFAGEADLASLVRAT
jgi:diaminopimelate epimerase